MNINLDKKALRKFKHGKVVDNLYKFEVRWYEPSSINQPYDVDKDEVKTMEDAIEDNRRVEPVVVLHDKGIVAGFHLLEAFVNLKYEKIPILYGKLR